MPSSNLQHCEQQLREGLTALTIELSEAQIAQLMQYLQEFIKWNKAYNLSAIRDPQEMVLKHLLDSLALIPHLTTRTAERIIDVGTGGGLPGIPLAIVFPDKQFTLLDSNGKKTRFLFNAKLTLKLDNIHVENNRAEQYQPSYSYDIVVSRAFASLQDMVNVTRHLLADKGVFWAMKGVYPENELRDCEKNAIVDSLVKLDVPGLLEERHLLILKPTTLDQ